MAAEWETLRMAVEMGDFSLAASLLTTELGFESKSELKPFLRGVLESVIRDEDLQENGPDPPTEENGAGKAPKPPRKKGGFSARFAPKEKPTNDIVPWKETNEAAPDLKSCAERRWRRTISAMLTDEAAIALQTLLLEEYRRESFSKVAAELDNAWSPDVTFNQRLEAIDDLCLKSVLRDMLPRFGFPGNAVGRKDMKTTIDEMAKKNSVVRQLTLEMPRVVVPLFPNLTKGNRIAPPVRQTVLRDPGMDAANEAGTEQWSRDSPSRERSGFHRRTVDLEETEAG